MVQRQPSREHRQIAAGKAKREQSSRQALFEQAEAYWNSPAGIAEAAQIQAFCEEWERQGRPAAGKMKWPLAQLT